MYVRPKYARVFGVLVAAGLASLPTQDAQAAAFALMEQNASGLGNAYAGQAAAAEDASTIFFNPAGMTYIRGRQVVGALNMISPKSEFNDEGSTLPGGFSPAAANDGGDAGDLAFVPNAYLSWELIPNKIWLGLGVNAPFGLKTEYDEDWIGRFHAVKSDVKTININPSVAWKATEAISIGVGLNLQRFEAELSNQQLLGALTQTLATVEGDDWSWGWNVGLMVDISPSTRLGIAYRSKIDYDLDGDVSAPVPSPLLNAPIEAEVELPDTLSIALSHQISPRLQLLADYTWTGWDSIQNIEIYRGNGTGLSYLPLRFSNSWRAGLGLNYQVDDAWKLRFGIAYDKTPTKDEFRTPRLPDEDRFWAAIGAQWKPSKQLAVDVGYAYIWPDDPEIDLPSTDPNPPPGFSGGLKGNLVGDYDANVQILSIQVSYSF